MGRISSVERTVFIKDHYRTIPAKILNPVPDANGYLRTVLRRKGKSVTVKVHRIVADAWVSGRTLSRNEINHINAKKEDNSAQNLEWVTREQNLAHAKRHGLWVAHYGSKNGNSKLNEDDVKVIRDMLSFKIHRDAIAKLYCIHPSTIKKIKYRIIWGWLK